MSRLGVSVAEQILLVEGTVLRDNRQSLFYYGIKENASITLDVPSLSD